MMRRFVHIARNSLDGSLYRETFIIDGDNITMSWSDADGSNVFRVEHTTLQEYSRGDLIGQIKRLKQNGYVEVDE
jgi:hypothetical protein